VETFRQKPLPSASKSLATCTRRCHRQKHSHNSFLTNTARTHLNSSGLHCIDSETNTKPERLPRLQFSTVRPTIRSRTRTPLEGLLKSSSWGPEIIELADQTKEKEQLGVTCRFIRSFCRHVSIGFPAAAETRQEPALWRRATPFYTGHSFSAWCATCPSFLRSLCLSLSSMSTPRT
jgi:hypothetical protein